MSQNVSQKYIKYAAKTNQKCTKTTQKIPQKLRINATQMHRKFYKNTLKIHQKLIYFLRSFLIIFARFFGAALSAFLVHCSRVFGTLYSIFGVFLVCFWCNFGELCKKILQKCNKHVIKMQKKCRDKTIQMQQKCNKNALKIMQWGIKKCNKNT